MRIFASSTIASLKFVRNASYSTSFFVTGNCNLTAYFKISPYGDMRTTLAPPAFMVVNPSVGIVHVLFRGSSSS